ncbi:MAG TPA: hypothetical protein VFG91_04335 [Woeseiaceae bacterium]|nr:hypothetical protein [Woeseiaceae bacterium]
MADDYTATIRIRRPSKVTTDDRGRTVWVGEIQETELELVSTAELKQILASSDPASRSAIEQVASIDTDGVLARNTATGLFEIVSDSDLEAALGKDRRQPAGASGSLEPATGRSGEDLSLVSTQVLRKVLKSDVKPGTPKTDAGGGFDPYNNG